MNTELFDIKIRAVEGGVTAAAGFKAAGIHAGFRKNPERLDYALVVPGVAHSIVNDLVVGHRVGRHS